jgi:UPF0755 protein
MSENDPNNQILTDNHPRDRKSGKVLAIFLGLALLMGVGGFLLINFMPNLQGMDYYGDGTSSVTVTIPEGASSREIGQILQDNDVVASGDYFVRVLNNEFSDPLMAGMFDLHLQMSSAAAIRALLDPANISAYRFTIPEGKTVNQTLEILAETTGTSVSALETIMKSVQAELPAAANGVFEGWLFPSTYAFPRTANFTELFKMLINTTKSILTQNEIPENRWQEILNKASIVQVEVPVDDFPKAARVIENRLTTDATSHLLGMDATIAYGLGINAVQLTYAQLEDASNPYNTRVHPGLPPTPISNPGEAAIQAAFKPAQGDWLYFVTVNLLTHETKFTASAAEFEQFKAEFEKWFAEHASEL